MECNFCARNSVLDTNDWYNWFCSLTACSGLNLALPSRRASQRDTAELTEGIHDTKQTINYNGLMKRRQFDHVLRIFMRRKPFKAFIIELTSGTRIEVRHPEAVSLGEEAVLVKNTDGIQQVFDYSTVAQFMDSPPSS